MPFRGHALGGRPCKVQVARWPGGKYGTVNFEVRAQSGDSIGQDARVVIAAIDGAGRIIDTATEYLFRDSFCALKTVSVTLGLNSFEVAKVRIYPELG